VQVGDIIVGSVGVCNLEGGECWVGRVESYEGGGWSAVQVEEVSIKLSAVTLSVNRIR
jgi:hypothetical protein